MLRARQGSVLATSISLVAVILTTIVATITFYENTTRRVNSERWRDVAEQAARSGLDMVLGWAEAHIDMRTSLPASWEMTDGQITDPVLAFLSGQGTLPEATDPKNATPGQLLEGRDVGEYVLARNGNMLVTFKARLQQYQISPEMPRQYRLAVMGRVRKASALDGKTLNNSEREGIVSQRMILAHVGKEPFSKYAALIDIDAVRNWVPGEIVYGPVHINRGYVDDQDDLERSNMKLNSQANLAVRSQMVIHDENSPIGFDSVGEGIAKDFPVFLERVSMTAMGDGDGSENDDNFDFSTGNTFLQYNGGAFDNLDVLRAQQIFLHPDNTLALGTINGPVIEDSPVAMPRSSRSRLSSILGVRSGLAVSDFPWFNRLEDGVYVFTTRTWDPSQAPAAGDSYIPSTFTYNETLPDDHASGGIYIRGNVELMRMAVNGNVSFYLFQLGYGAGLNAGDTPARRLYIVRVDRETKQMDLYASSAGMSYDQLRNPAAPVPMPPLAQFDAFLAAVNGSATPFVDTTDPTDFLITGANAVHATLAAPPADRNFAFNGSIFVDISAHDPARDLSNPFDTNGNAPYTGNIYALGDPGRALAPADKLDAAEVVSTVDPGTNKASKLTILAAGNIFIQNNIYLQDIVTDGIHRDPQWEQFSLDRSRDLIGLVADKQIVLGTSAPSGNRGEPGTVVHAAIAALGDPDYNFTSNTVLAADRSGTTAYRGSFTTEGLMQLFSGAFTEDYFILAPNSGLPLGYAGVDPAPWLGIATNYTPPDPATRYPATPMTAAYAGATISSNPNLQPRGNLLIFGAITQKRRGVVGVSNRSFDKDFRYDKRLQSIAPPLFPTSTNVRLRLSRSFTPSNVIYHDGGAAPALDPNEPGHLIY